MPHAALLQEQRTEVTVNALVLRSHADVSQRTLSEIGVVCKYNFALSHGVREFFRAVLEKPVQI